MVYSSAPQDRSTYELWSVFSMPLDGDSQKAVAVPSSVATKLVSAYTLLMISMVTSLWCSLLATFLFLRGKRNTFHPISTSLWNKRHSTTASLLELLQCDEDSGKWSQQWFFPVVFLTLGIWVGQIALSIVGPSAILLDHAAPVKVASIRVPNNNYSDRQRLMEVFSLDVAAALRAVGTAQVASSGLQSKISVSATNVGTTSKNESVIRYRYSYNISGSDMGLQHFPALQLAVSGGCVTEYGWFNLARSNEIVDDVYNMFGNDSNKTQLAMHLGDTAAPTAWFSTGPNPSGWQTNMTWAAFVSSANRYSPNTGQDPFYETERNPNNDSWKYIIRRQRPVLSCWETDLWTNNGRSTRNILQLAESASPVAKLPHSLMLIFTRYISIPVIVSVGTSLGFSALRSPTTSLGAVVDASQSSMVEDLKRLVLTSYIATTNMLTDTTLVGDLPPDIDNMALGEDGEILDGVGDFVVWTSDAAALSLKYLILIPVLAVVMWLLVYILLHYTRVQIVRSLDASTLYNTILYNFPSARPCSGRDWTIDVDEQTGFDKLSDVNYANPKPHNSVTISEAEITNTQYDGGGIYLHSTGYNLQY